MVEAHVSEGDTDLPPPGFRWGAGAQSVLPYLTKTLQARPAAVTEPRDPHAPERAALPATDARRAA